jgi:hypothetical protein
VITAARDRAGTQTAINHALFAVVPITVTVWLLMLSVHSAGYAAVDFSSDFRVAGLRLLHGMDPYAWSTHQIAAGVSFPYPAATALLFVPFALLPAGVSAAVFTGVCVIATAGTLWVLGVRDWRLYGLVLMWSPVVAGWQTANLTLPLALGVALTWRFRNSPVPAGLFVALLVSIKPITLPLVLWLVATRRYSAMRSVIAFGLAINLVGWAVVGFDGIARWLRLLSVQGDLLYRKGYSLIALAANMGLGRDSGTAIEIVAAAVLVAACVVAGRRRLDVEAFMIAVALMVVASPQVDLHYFALLIVPLALAQPRLGLAWLVPLVFWVCPSDHPSSWQVALVWAVAASLTLMSVRRSEPSAFAGLRAGVSGVPGMPGASGAPGAAGVPGLD